MSESPPAVAEYVDGNGNTWQLDEATAKRLGYKRVAATKVENKVIAADAVEASAAPVAKPPRRGVTAK